MRARRPEVAVNSYAGPIARLPIIRTYITAAPAGDMVRRVYAYDCRCSVSRVTVTPPFIVGGGSCLCGCARVRSRAPEFGGCLADFRSN